MPHQREPSPEEEEDIADLPERNALSVLPTSLIGGLGTSSPLGGDTTGSTDSTGTSLGGSLLGGGSTTPADPNQVPAPTTTDPSTAPAPPPISIPSIPVPTENPDGTYTSDATSTDQT